MATLFERFLGKKKRKKREKGENVGARLKSTRNIFFCHHLRVLQRGFAMTNETLRRYKIERLRSFLISRKTLSKKKYAFQSSSLMRDPTSQSPIKFTVPLSPLVSG